MNARRAAQSLSTLHALRYYLLRCGAQKIIWAALTHLPLSTTVVNKHTAENLRLALIRKRAHKGLSV